MSNANTFKNKSSFEIWLDSLRYIHRKTLLPLELSEEEQAAVSDIKQDGFTVIPNFIDQETLESMQRLFQGDLEKGEFEMPTLAQSKIDPIKHKSIIDNYVRGSGQFFKDQGIGFDKNEFVDLSQCINDFHPSTLKSYYNPEQKLFFEAMLSSRVMNIVEGYMGLRPYLIEAYTRRNFPAKYRAANHHWHRDTNNKSFLIKTFLFLTDCDENNGPHHYIKGSHKNFKLNNNTYYGDREVSENYSMKKSLVLSKVKAGTLVIEDTRGLHKAGVPLEGYRDLVYGVFFPERFYSRWRTSYYDISESVYAELSALQRSYIPKNNLA